MNVPFCQLEIHIWCPGCVEGEGVCDSRQGPPDQEAERAHRDPRGHCRRPEAAGVGPGPREKGARGDEGALRFSVPPVHFF
jgi:hypothetical protein